MKIKNIIKINWKTQFGDKRILGILVIFLIVSLLKFSMPPALIFFMFTFLVLIVYSFCSYFKELTSIYSPSGEKYHIEKDKIQIIASLLMAFFMFMAFLMSWLTYSQVYAPHLTTSGYNCEKRIGWSVGSSISVLNLGMGNSIYDIKLTGKNLNFSTLKQSSACDYSSNKMICKFSIGGNSQSTFAFRMQVINRTVKTASYNLQAYTKEGIPLPSTFPCFYECSEGICELNEIIQI